MRIIRFIKRFCHLKFFYLLMSLFLMTLLFHKLFLFKVNDVITISIEKPANNIAEYRYENSSCTLPIFPSPIPVKDSERFVLNCGSNSNIVNIYNGKLIISSSESTTTPQCSYRILKRVNDFKTDELPTSNPFRNGDPIPHDYFTVACSTLKWFSGGEMPLIGIKPQLQLAAQRSQIPLQENAFGYNVILLGFDSVSRLSFMKNLPKSYDFFTNEMEGVVFQKHNIIGDGTTSNILGALTGHKETDLPEARRSKPNAKSVDNFPFVMKNFKKSGYMTLFAEDQQDYGTFQYRLHGFDQPPTDHYTRPYFLRMPYDNQGCLGSIPRHNVMFNLLKEYFRVYNSSVRKFGHLFQADTSHDNNNHLHPVDEDLVNILKEFKTGGLFDKTILFLFSDHGARFSNHRSTLQGKYEERLPFLGIYLPKDLRISKPELMQNLLVNSKKLTSHYDTHATLLHILGESKPQGLKSISLLEKIPSQRSCSDVTIEPHWCICSQWKTLPTTNHQAVLAAQEATKYINRVLKPFEHLCSNLQLEKLTSVEYYQVNNALLKFKKSADNDGYTADLSDDMKISHEIYRITFLASPGDALLEATVRFDIHTKSYVFHENQISRINKYGNLAACLGTTYPHMRKFCICKSAL